MKMKLRPVLWIALLVAGCESVADDRALIDKPRLLAVRASPPILAGPAASVRLESLFVDGDGARNDREPVRYRACSPWIFVVDPERDCPEEQALPLSERTLSSDELLAFYPPPEYAPDAPAPRPDADDACGPGPVLEVPIIASVRVEGVSVITMKRVPIFLDQVERRNPFIAGLADVSQADSEERRLEVMIAPESLDRLCEDGDEALEPVRVYLYATSGELSPKAVDIVPGPDDALDPGEFTWTAAEAGARLWLVAIDRSGGVGWASGDGF